MTETVNTRELILSILLEVNKEGSYSHLVIRNVLDKYRFLDQRERSFIKRVSEGVIERKLTLDYLISRVSTVKPAKMKPVIREIIRMGVYQLKFMDQIPASAVCNESVKLAEKKGFRNLKGFVNGVLRNIDRMEMPDQYPDWEKQYSMPSFLCSLFADAYGSRTAEKMIQASLQSQKMYIRINRLRNSPEKCQEILSEEQVQTHRFSFWDDVLEIEGSHGLTTLQSFRNGCYTVQDLSSILVGHVANVKNGMTVIDVCAAPGGKTFHVAELMENTGLVISRDLTEKKTALIQEGMERLSLHNIKVQTLDATTFRKEDVGLADLVIADLPCSGLGVLARKNDLKYRIQEEDLKNLQALQQKILCNIVQYIKPGGHLIFSTCTVNPSENIENRNYIIHQLGLVPESIEELLPAFCKGRTGNEGYIQLLQGVDPCDGFFISKFEKR